MQRKTIILVEQENSIRQTLKESLNSYDVQEACNLTEAFIVLKNKNADALVTHLGTSKQEEDLLESLKHQGHTLLPVVAFSGHILAKGQVTDRPYLLQLSQTIQNWIQSQV